MLWLDLLEPNTGEAREVAAAFGVDDLDEARLRDPDLRPGLEQPGDHIRVTAVSASAREGDTPSRLVAFECVVGANWLVTVRNDAVSVIDDFRERAEGAGELGLLDAPSFLASLLEWAGASS